MIGAIKRKKLMLENPREKVLDEHICPLCLRPIPESQKDAHHLIPKSKGGKTTEYLHRICHRQIHALLTETELANHFNHIEALLSHPEISKFTRWVKTKPNDFYERTRKSSRLKSKN